MEPSNNTETEEETTAFRRKRLRRVSFADNEITSVHIFHRDEDDSSGTPPVSTPDHEILGFFSDLAGDCDNDDKESSSPPDAEAVDGRDSFLRPVGSPSPGGSSTAGSVASTDDDDDFHGPVSASFIRPDRLSDSGISDDNHDHTMDSTAFSMHYRSLARSESGDLKTPTRFGLQFEEKTPSKTSSPLCAPGSLMELTKAKKQTCQSEVSSPDVGSGGRDSSDMCIVGEKLQTYDYDYDRLPPTLDAILAEGSKDLSAISPLDSKAAGLLSGYLKTEGSSDSAMGNVGKDDMAVKEAAPSKLGDLNGYSIGSMVIQVTDDSLYNKGDSTVGHVAIHQIQTPVSSIKEINEVVKGETVPIDTDFTTPRTSSLREGVNRLKHRLSKYSPGTPLFNEKDYEYKQLETLNVPLVEKLFSLTPESNVCQSLINIDDHVIQSSRSISKLSPSEENVYTIKDGKNFHLVPVDYSFNDKNWKPVETTASPSQVAHLDRIIDFDVAGSTADNKNDGIEIVAHDKTLTSPNQKLSPSVECQRNCCDELKPLDKPNESISTGLGNTEKPSNLELSGFVNTEKPSSPFVFSQDNKSAKGATESKLAQSSAENVLVLSTPIQEVTTPLPSDGHDPIDNNYHSELQVAESPATKTGVGISSGKKRKGVKISSGKKRKGVKILSGGDNIDKKGGLARRNPDVNKSGNSKRGKVGDQTWNDWADILKCFLGSTNQLLPPSVEKLNLRSIGMLEDILVHVQKVKKMEILCSEIHSQIITDPLSIPRHKRVMEARMLMFNIAYEKAKLQLMNIKREKLQKKVEQLRSGLEESQMLKSFISSSHKSRAMDTQDSDSNIHTSLLNSKGKCQDSCEKVTRMRQELETLDSEAKSLNEFFHSYCNIAGDQGCVDTIKSIHDYLQKRMSCKFISKNLKLWDIEDFERENGCFKVLLNYCSYVFQRFTINASQHSITVSNNLNDVNIVKTFPNMDALSAFVFVLNPNATKEYSSSICLAQETQITSSLLSNLLDVVEEVQSARMEIRNLVDTKFYSHSVHQLDLQLSFIDFYSAKKVKVTLDLTCLKCAVYPVEVVPAQIYDPAGAEQKPLPSSLIDGIRTAAESMEVGYSRVTRLCRCISQAVQAWGQSR